MNNMTWNHRVMRHESGPIGFCDDGCWYGIHEVYYDEQGNVDGYTKDALVTGDNIEDLKWALQKMLECLEKPVLEYEE